MRNNIQAARSFLKAQLHALNGDKALYKTSIAEHYVEAHPFSREGRNAFEVLNTLKDELKDVLKEETIYLTMLQLVKVELRKPAATLSDADSVKAQMAKYLLAVHRQRTRAHAYESGSTQAQAQGHAQAQDHTQAQAHESLIVGYEAKAAAEAQAHESLIVGYEAKAAAEAQAHESLIVGYEAKAAAEARFDLQAKRLAAAWESFDKLDKPAVNSLDLLFRTPINKSAATALRELEAQFATTKQRDFWR